MKKALPWMLALPLAFAAGILTDRLWLHPGAVSDLENGPFAPSPFELGLTRAPAEGSPDVPGNADAAGFAEAAATRQGRPYRGGLSDLLALIDPNGWNTDERVLDDALKGIKADDALRLVEALGSLDRKDPRSDAVRRAVYKSYAQADPQGALAYVSQHDSDRGLKGHVVYHAFEALSKTNFEEAVALFAASDLREEERHGALWAMSRGIQPDQAAAFADFIQDKPQARHFGDLFRRWAQHDPENATDYALKLENPSLQTEWLRAAVHGWARTDPRAALNWVDRLAPDNLQQRAMEGLMHAAATEDPQLAAELMDSVPNGERKGHFASTLAREWAQTDLVAAREWVQSLDPATSGQALRGLLHTWSREDPAAAAAFVEEYPPSEALSDALHELAGRWAEKDLSAAATWASNQSDHENRSRALEAVAGKWAESDPQSAAAFAATVENPRARGEMLENIGHHWARQDLDGAVAWANELPLEDRARAAGSVVRHGGEIEGTAGARRLFGELTADLSVEALNRSEFGDLAGGIAHHLTRENPQEAAAWVADLPAGSDVQREAVERVAEQWLETDSLRASEWIGQLPQGDVRDAAAGQLVENIARSDPAAAFAWAMSVSSEEQRNDLMHDTLEQWREIDPAAARQSLDTVPLSEEHRQDLLEVLEE